MNSLDKYISVNFHRNCLQKMNKLDMRNKCAAGLKYGLYVFVCKMPTSLLILLRQRLHYAISRPFEVYPGHH